MEKDHPSVKEQLINTKLGSLLYELIDWRDKKASIIALSLINIGFFLIYYFDLYLMSTLGFVFVVGVFGKILFNLLDGKLSLSAKLGRWTEIGGKEVGEVLSILLNGKLSLFWRIATFSNPILSLSVIVGTLLASYITSFFSDFVVMYLAIIFLFSVTRIIEIPAVRAQLHNINVKTSEFSHLLLSKLPPSIANQLK